MASYRLLFFKRDRDGGPDHRITLTCADDTEAIRRALELTDGRRMELWRAGVFVKSWPGGVGASR